MSDMLVDLTADGVEDFSLVGKKGAQPINDHLFQVARWDPAATRADRSATAHKRGRHVVPVSGSLFDGPGRRQPVSSLVEDHAGQQAWLLRVGAVGPRYAVLGERGLHGVP